MRPDLLYAFRSLRRSPAFAAVAIVSLALGIGTTTAIFSLMDQAVLRSLPVHDPDSLVVVHRDYSMNGSDSSDNYESVFSWPMYRDLREADRSFSSVIARSRAGVAISTGRATWQSSGEIVSGDFFEALGVGAAAGRVLYPSDDRPGAAAVIVLSHAAWVTRFAASPSVVNQVVDVNKTPATVIGVAAESFNGLQPGSTPDFYVPLAMQKIVSPTLDILEDGMYRWLNIFARLRPGFTLSKAQAATDGAHAAVLAAELRRFPELALSRERNAFLKYKVQLRPAAQGINGLGRDWKKPLTATLAMSLLTLLIACANIAGLMLARAVARQREVSIRVALGAGRGAIARILIAEAALVSIAGAAAGIFAAWAMKTALLRILPHDYARGWISAAIDLRMLGFALMVAVACTAVCGLAPALHAARSNVSAALKDAAAQISSATPAARMRRFMVAAQVALSLTVLMAGGLFGRSLENLSNVDTGFRTERLITFSVNATSSRPQLAAAVAFYRDLEQRIGQIPGARGVAAADSGPFSSSTNSGNITIDGYRPPDGKDAGSETVSVGPGFFRAIGVPMLAGREFADRDNASAPHAVIVNETFVRRYLAGSNPIGRRLMFGSSNRRVFDLEIVGVAADSRKELRKPPDPVIYRPYAQWRRPTGLMFYVRSGIGEARMIAAIRNAVRSLDASVPISDPEPINVRIRNTLYTDRLLAILSAIFGALALALAAIGLYGVVAYMVARRTSEIGVRMALGALPRDVLRLVMSDAGRIVVTGIVAGGIGALAVGRIVASQLYEMPLTDWSVLLGAAGALALVAGIAALFPALRASAIAPSTALKYE
jgi:predicted permease